MPYDASATRSRLIEAATREFAAHGLAGARVDRIADAAAANKRAIYDYFTNKQGLFDTALARVTDDLIQAIPLDENDLPNYAGELFDYLQKHPHTVRILAWQRLERPHAGPPIPKAFLEHIAQLRDRPRAKTSEQPLAPLDLIVLTIGLANAWHLSAPALLASQGIDPADPERIARHRAAVIEATRRLAEPA